MYYAHSGIAEKNILPQTYEEHIRNVCSQSEQSALHLLKEQYLVDAVILAALYHDMGKLHAESQDVLAGRIFKDHLLNHVDAGVAYLIAKFQKTQNITYALAAWLVHAHHRGLVDFDKFFVTVKNKYAFTADVEIIINDDEIRDNNIRGVSDHYISEYITISESLLPDWHNYPIGKEASSEIPCAVLLRMMLSCLVDADHGDTARHYGAPQKTFSIPLHPEQKIDQLDKYLDSLQSYGTPERQLARRMLLQANKHLDTSHSFYCVDSPVGTGKTYSVLRGALRIAAAKGCSRIFTVLPFTNVISQSVAEYRNALQASEWVVAEIHSKVEFSNFLLRKFNALWDAPINVSTAVQFFECIWSNHPVALRKFKQFANSVIIIDEFHSAMPHNYWKVALQIMKMMAEHFNTTFIFASGTACRYWRIFDDIKIHVHEVLPESTYEHLQQQEMARVSKTDLGLVSNIVSYIDPSKSSLNVFNTINNALKIALEIPEAFYVSSAMTPIHRERVIAEIKLRLKNNEKIQVVSTSILECGHDLSFDTGLREWCGVNSINQCSGRINRGSFNPDAQLRMVELDGDFTENPQIRKATQIARSFDIQKLSPKDCTDAIAHEIDMKEAHSYYLMEQSKAMKSLGELRVINSDTFTIICDQDIITKLQNNELVYPIHINRASVQVYENKLNKLNLIQLDDRIYGLQQDTYNPKYGIVT